MGFCWYINCKIIQAHKDSITMLKLDQYLLFSSSDDYSIKIWETKNNQMLYSL